jgi:hypothetical protein
MKDQADKNLDRDAGSSASGEGKVKKLSLDRSKLKDLKVRTGLVTGCGSEPSGPIKFHY